MEDRLQTCSFWEQPEPEPVVVFRQPHQSKSCEGKEEEEDETDYGPPCSYSSLPIRMREGFRRVYKNLCNFYREIAPQFENGWIPD
ncbi:hypothetical protein BDZ91DRAFT_721416 [Kalaharituber pfeilii]|nr:hypothetical protein BDZ91DRAFT_721416 [Kalaharituber pfeilii]